jgi:4-hydroxymandelate oxidase
MSELALPQRRLDKIPPEILCAADYEVLARNFISPPGYEYIAGGTGHGRTVAANLRAFQEWAICPRLLRDVTGGHTRLTLPECDLPHPILLAPVALQKLVHPLGEVETARAAAATGSCMVSSTLSSCTLEEIAMSAGPERWFQLYFQPSPEATQSLLRRSETAGYGAIVLTVDAPVQAPSHRSLRAGFRMPADCVPANLRDIPDFLPHVLEEGQSRILHGMMREAPTWKDLDWILQQTTLPVWVKGVLHPDDARELQLRGVAGIVVSNHGGRSLDGAPPSLGALVGIRAAVGDSFPLLLDGGVRSGEDIFKALALGADAVLIGRLQVYALAVAGALGVAHVLKLLRDELELCMALAGCATLADIRRTGVVRAAQPRDDDSQ